MKDKEKVDWWDRLCRNEQIRLMDFYGASTSIGEIYDAEHASKEAPKEYDFITPPHYRIYEGEDKEV